MKRKKKHIDIKPNIPQAAEAPAAAVSRKTRLIFAALILILVLVAYSSAFSNDFIWDDEFLIRDNIAIRSFGNIAKIFKTYLAASSGNLNNFYRPIQELSYMIDMAVWKNNPFGYHLTNVLLHAIAALCVYLLSMRILGNASAAFITAALFGIHPINTEAVTYVAGRADSLYLLFFLASFILFLKATDGLKEGKSIGPGYYAVSMACAALSVMSKEIGVILPLFLLLYVFSFHRLDGLRNRLLALCLPYAGISAAYIIVRRTILDFSHIAPSFNTATVDFFLRMFAEARVICLYLWLLIAPFGLHMERMTTIPRSIFGYMVIPALAFIGFLLTALWLCRRKSPGIFFGGAWFFVGLIPVANIVPINSFVAEHWLYLPAIGIYMIAAVGISGFFFKNESENALNIRRIIGWLVVAAILIFYGTLTFERNKDWKDEITFFKSTLKHVPDNARLHLNFGNTYTELGRYDEAIQEYLIAVKFFPEYAEAYNNLGSSYRKIGDLQKAKEYLDKSLELDPKSAVTIRLRGNIYEIDGDSQKAEEMYIKSIGFYPTVDAYKSLGQLYYNRGQLDKTLECARKILEIHPGEPEAMGLLAEYSMR